MQDRCLNLGDIDYAFKAAPKQIDRRSNSTWGRLLIAYTLLWHPVPWGFRPVPESEHPLQIIASKFKGAGL